VKREGEEGRGRGKGKREGEEGRGRGEGEVGGGWGQALVQDQGSPFFTTAHFDGHPSVLIRGSRIGELTVIELAEVIQDAWLARASSARAAAWLSARG
jgi:hypothetical protein